MYNVYIMIRKQLYLTPDLNQTVKLLSLKERKPEAEVIREVMKLGIEAKTHGKKNIHTGLIALAETAIPGLQTNLSTSIDKELYEQ
jgi:hypothetical protein